MSETEAGSRQGEEASARRGRDVFISHSGPDREVADRVCAALERSGIRCWIAPRDTAVGAYSRSIMEAIKSARMLVLVLSPHADQSPNVLAEVAEAFDRNVPLVPFRIAEFDVGDALRFYIRTQHWIDAFPGPPQHHVPALLERVKDGLGREVEAREAAAASPQAASRPATPGPTNPVGRGRRRRWSFAIAGTIGAVSIGLSISFMQMKAPPPTDPPRQGVRTRAFDTSTAGAGVVRVIAIRAEGEAAGSKSAYAGTGFVVAEGFVLTAAHVIDPSISGGRMPEKRPHVSVIATGDTAPLAGEIFWLSPDLDLAVIKVPSLKQRPLTLMGGLPSYPPQGAQVFTLAYSGFWGDAATRTSSFGQGVVSSTRSITAHGVSHWAIEHSALLGEGASGSPLFDGCAVVVGINYRRGEGQPSRTILAQHISAFVVAARTRTELRPLVLRLAESPCRG